MKQLNFSGFCSEEFPQRKALDRGIENLTTVELISDNWRRNGKICRAGSSDLCCNE